MPSASSRPDPILTPPSVPGLDDARAVMAGLADQGIDFAAVTKELEDEGVAAFADAYNGMLDAIAKRHAAG